MTGRWFALVFVVGALLSRLYAAWPRIREAGQVRWLLLRLLVAFSLLGAAFGLAFGIDREWFAGIPEIHRFLIVPGMMAMMIYGVLLLIGAPEIESEGAFPTRPLKWTIGGVLVGIGLLVGGIELQERTGLPLARMALVVLGATLIGLTLFRPDWFWGHHKAQFLRRLIGDRATIVAYLAFGVWMCWFALTAATGEIARF